jgi:hypothetical protein
MVRGAMSETRIRAGASELWRLSVRERGLSGIRRRLHEQIDGGVADDWIRQRERRISSERRALHDQIDELRADRARRAT